MNAIQIAQTRYTTKHYDPTKRVSDADLDALLEVLRLSPSSVNSQPWEFFVAGTEEAKSKVMPAVLDFNRARVQNASHIIICAVREDMDAVYLKELIEQEARDGRFGDDTTKTQQLTGRAHFVGLHRVSPSELISWESRQAYIAQGFLLFAAASMGVDSTPLEGMDFSLLDDILDLRAKGLRSIYAVSLGYRAADDSNALRPKSRWPRERIIHTI